MRGVDIRSELFKLLETMDDDAVEYIFRFVSELKKWWGL